MFFQELSLVSDVDEREYLVPQCGSCGLHRKCNSPKMRIEGLGKKKILLVLPSPSVVDDQSCIAFSGDQGKLIRSTLDGLGINMMRDCWMTFAAICAPKGVHISLREASYCRPNLKKTIEELQPNLIIPFGQAPISSVIKLTWGAAAGKATEWFGWRIPSQKYNCWICPNEDPASVLIFKKSTIIADYFVHRLTKAIRLHKERPYKVVPDYRDLVMKFYDVDRELLRWLSRIKSGDTIAFDYETNCLKPESKSAKIVTMSICVNGDYSMAFPFAPKDANFIREIRRILTDTRIEKIASNAKYEDRWTRTKIGVEVYPWKVDTMLMAHLLDCRPGITGLKFQSFVQLGQPIYDGKVDAYLKSKDSGGYAINQIHKIPYSDLLEYNGMDSMMSYLVGTKQMEQFEDAQ